MPATLEQLVSIQSQTVWETLDYLDELIKDSSELPEYYPPHLRETDSNGSHGFESIRQTVQVHDRKRLDEWMQEQRQKRESGKEKDVNALAYGAVAEERDDRPKSFEWNDEASRGYRRAIILASPGFGKTWLLRQEALSLLVARKQCEKLQEGAISLDEVIIPVFLRLPTLANEDAPFDRALLNVAAKDRPHLRALIAQKLKQENGCVLLLDAWDEVPCDRRTKLKHRLLEFAKAYPLPTMRLASRIVGYDSGLKKLVQEKEQTNEFVLIQFNQMQIDAFVKTWFGGERERASAFLTALRSQSHLGGLAQIPLLLSLLTWVYSDPTMNRLPGTRSELYGQCLERFLEQWGKIDGKDVLLEEVDESIGRVQGLLRSRLPRSSRVRPEKQIVGWLKAEVKLWLSDGTASRAYDAKQLLQVAKAMRILEPVSRAGGDDRLRFVPRDLNAVPRDAKTVARLIRLLGHTAYALEKEQFDFNELEATLTHLAQQSDIVDFISRYGVTRMVEVYESSGILRRDGTSETANYIFLHKSFQEYLVARGLAETEDCLDVALQHVYDPGWHEVLVLLGGCFEDADKTRVYIRQLLEKMPEDLLLRPLLMAAEAASEAGDELSSLFKEELVAKLFHIFFEELLPWPRVFHVLGLFPDLFIPRLCDVLGDEKQDRYLRELVAQTLGQMGGKEAIPGMLAILQDDKQDWRLRKRVATSLGQIGGKEAIPEMLAILRDDKQDGDVRLQVAEALEQMGAKEATPEMLAILRDDKQDRSLRWHVGEILWQMEVKEAVPEMRAIARDSQQDKGKNRVVYHLGHMGGEEAIREMPAFLRGDKQDRYVRGQVAQTLGQMGVKEAIPDMLAIVRADKQDGYLRGQVAKSLGQMGAKVDSIQANESQGLYEFKNIISDASEQLIVLLHQD
ncbi:MAG: HEAT repeat domain-containing protein [Candidatus Hodarchaeales archaeon]|jgi:HEAT repeat protein